MVRYFKHEFIACKSSEKFCKLHLYAWNNDKLSLKRLFNSVTRNVIAFHSPEAEPYMRNLVKFRIDRSGAQSAHMYAYMRPAKLLINCLCQADDIIFDA